MAELGVFPDEQLDFSPRTVAAAEAEFGLRIR
jgi:hypothetical protein